MGCCFSFLNALFGSQEEEPILPSNDIENEEPYQNEGLLPDEGDNPIYYTSPGVGRYLNELTEEEQFNLARKIEYLDRMASTTVNIHDKIQECAICMTDAEVGETVRYLPCTHMFHKVCVDTWLMRSLTCPTCMEELTEAIVYLSNR